MDSAHELTAELPATAASIGRARALLDELAGHDATADDLWPARLLLSEVVTNAVRHGSDGPDNTVGVRLCRTEATLRVEIRDHGAGFAPSPRAPNHTLGSGWGLHFVSEVASRWGVEIDDGTLVWFEVPLDDDPDERPP